jgi:predicted ATPase
MKLTQVRVNGYKNLINAELDLGDFNVLVGPNNSGKSNLLEAIQLLGGLCKGSDKVREAIFHGATPPSRAGLSISRLKKYAHCDITIGISMQINVDNEIWMARYDTTFKCDTTGKGERGFVSEVLTAKRPNMTGPSTTYLKRNGKELIVKEQTGNDKTHPISTDNSSILAIRSLYPDFQGLSTELKEAIQGLITAGATSVFSISAEDMRQSLRQGKPIEGLHIPSFDLSFVVDKINEAGNYKLFEENLCNIVNLEMIRLQHIDVPSTAKGQDKQSPKRLAFLLAKRKGADFALIDEYSDGTFAAAALLAILISEGNKGQLLCIEEPENYMHPKALEKLAIFLQENSDKWPALITTHSPYLLNCVKNPEDINVAVVDEDGATHFEKVRNNKSLRDYLKSGFMSFGDMLPSNFEDVLGGQRSANTKPNTSQ